MKTTAGGVSGQGRAAAGPARRRADRPQDCPPRQDRQVRHAPHTETRLHHRRPGCRSALAGCARGGVAYGPAHHDPVRSGPRQPGPARDLYRRRLRRGCRQATARAGAPSPPGGHAARRQLAPQSVTDRDLNQSVNRRSERPGLPRRSPAEPLRSRPFCTHTPWLWRPQASTADGLQSQSDCCLSRAIGKTGCCRGFLPPALRKNPKASVWGPVQGTHAGIFTGRSYGTASQHLVALVHVHRASLAGGRLATGGHQSPQSLKPASRRVKARLARRRRGQRQQGHPAVLPDRCSPGDPCSPRPEAPAGGRPSLPGRRRKEETMWRSA